MDAPDRFELMLEGKIVWPEARDVARASIRDDEPIVFCDDQSHFWIDNGRTVIGPFEELDDAIAQTGSPRLLIAKGKDVIVHSHEAGYGSGSMRLISTSGGYYCIDDVTGFFDGPWEKLGAAIGDSGILEVTGASTSISSSVMSADELNRQLCFAPDVALNALCLYVNGELWALPQDYM